MKYIEIGTALAVVGRAGRNSEPGGASAGVEVLEVRIYAEYWAT